MSPPDIARGLSQVRHLMDKKLLGLLPFHGSLSLFVEGLSDYQTHRDRVKRLALDWLKAAAPEYWKWAYAWGLEYELGNPGPLIVGPDRNWIIDAIAQGRPWKETLDVLEKSSWTALKVGNLPAFVKSGLFHGYLETRGFSFN